MDGPKVGVLALQGATEPHRQVLDALVLPGGESTTMRRLIDKYALREPILAMARRGAPMLGTCAGMILLAREITDGDEPVFSLLDISVKRNAFGRQLDSFETDLPVDGVDGGPVHAVFIRAPVVERVGDDVEVLADVDGRPVVCRQGNVLVAAFHPEIAGEPRLHELFLERA